MEQFHILEILNSWTTNMGRKKHQNLKSITHLTRKIESKSPKKIYLIACEGECTEPNYIKGLVKHQKDQGKIALGTEIKFSRHNHSDPYGVLQDLLNTPNLDFFDELWIVIDRDEVELKGKGFGGHLKENFNKTLEESQNKNVSVACSNPCFEFWILLHFEYRDTACTREEIQKKALEKVNTILEKEKQLRKVDELKSIENLYDLLKTKVDVAVRNANKLKVNQSKKQNPSTGMFKLLESLYEMQ